MTEAAVKKIAPGKMLVRINTRGVHPYEMQFAFSSQRANPLRTAYSAAIALP
jgi:hypothetical protein